ncbi:MAG: VWA domain-containing protein [Candidatus Dormiibacterota bacterium]
MAVTAERSGRFARSLALVMPDCRERLYWTARVALVSDQGQLQAFDAVFAAIFDGMLDPADSRGDTTGPPPVGSEPRPAREARPSAPVAGENGSSSLPRPSPAAAPSEPVAEREALPTKASALETLRQTAFAELTPHELVEVRRLVRRIVLATPLRRTRRTKRSNLSGQRLDLRRTLRRAQRTGGDPVRVEHRQKRLKSRRLVLLCDVSGSMEPYTRIFLSLLQGAVSGSRAEAFVFATRLTRLTRQLALRDPDQALAAAAVRAPDWASGTRLAASLRRFIDTHGRNQLARGSVVVVLSDGWDHDEPERLAVQMARLRRLTHRIVWINPRRAAPGYAPLVGGMAAALPFCDAFVSGHTLAALEDVARAVAAPRIRSTTKTQRRRVDAAE